MTTPHINAPDGAFAKTVLMPGDPMRAKYIAENYLEESRLVTDVRGMLGYTGIYEGCEISVMGSGMGIPSICIYSHELFSFYGVENIIRTGSCGGYSKDVKVGDIIIAGTAATDSSFITQFGFSPDDRVAADRKLLERVLHTAKEKKTAVHEGEILSTDVFYSRDPDSWKKWAKKGVLGVEMESAGLYAVAGHLKKRALGIFTVSDHFIFTEREMSSSERETGLDAMIRLSLESFAGF